MATEGSTQAHGEIGTGSGHGTEGVLCSGVASPDCLESLENPMPVGVGGVMMMFGTLRWLSLSTWASSLLLLLLLTHSLKPERHTT